MPHQFGARVSFDHMVMDLLRQLGLGKSREGTAEGGFAGNFTGTFPAAKLAQQRAGLERVKERPSGGELINVLGDEGVRQPNARTGRTTVAAPFVTPGEAAQIGECNDFAKLLIQGAQRAEFVRACGEKLPLQMVENRRQVGHEEQTLCVPSRSNNSKIIPNKSRF